MATDIFRELLSEAITALRQIRSERLQHPSPLYNLATGVIDKVEIALVKTPIAPTLLTEKEEKMIRELLIIQWGKAMELPRDKRGAADEIAALLGKIQFLK